MSSEGKKDEVPTQSTPCGRFWNTLRVMLYKNWLLKSRRPLSTFFEIAIPVLIMLAMIGIHSKIPKTEYADAIYADNGTNAGANYQSYFTFYDYQDYLQGLRPQHKFALAPKDQTTQAMSVNLAMLLQRNLTDFVYFDNDKELNTYLQDQRYGIESDFPPLYVALTFYSYGPWDYAIRMNSTGFNAKVPATNSPVTSPLARGVEGSWTTYKMQGFLWFQMFVDNWIFNQTAGLPWNLCTSAATCHQPQVIAEPYSVSFVPFPTKAYTSDIFAIVAGNLLGLFFTIGYLWPTSRLVRDLTLEKEKKIKEGMKMMGLSDAVFWLSWIITYVIIYLIGTIIIVAETKGSVYEFSNGNVIFLYFFVFSLSCFSLAVLISSFFDRAKSAATFGAIIFLALYFPFFGVTTSSTPSAYSAKVGVCLFSPACFGLGAQALASLESAGVGANYGNWQTRYDNFSVAACVGMMFFDCILYFILAWYIEKVFPGAYGTPHPFWFPFMPSYWCPRQLDAESRPPPKRRQNEVPLEDLEGGRYVKHDDENRQTGKSVDEEEKQAFGSDRYFEAVPKEVTDRPAVKILDIHKSFDVNGLIVQAVKGIDFDIYEGQITALLGHNGAGKSTLISMLTGLIPPTSGDAEVYGYHLTTEMARIRETLGVCPQHDVLFDDLTVYEHLELFARLKGTAGPLAAMIQEIIAEVGLTEKTRSASSTLSGGQKRKLSIAIALIGNSKVIFLDECTSGMDVYSRRWIWNMLLKKKEGRIIILTTHFMDEADQLGDRIAIMSKGVVKCCGSSLFLKNLYGVGYTMTVSKGEEADSQNIVEMVKRHVETAEQLTSVGGELQFRLPFTVSNKFPAMFEEMDHVIERGQEKKEVVIKSYGIAVTTLEEVFLRVGKEEALDTEEKKAVKLSRQRTESKMASANKFADMDKEQFQRDGFHVGVRHFYALFIKRWHNARRDRRQWLFQVILPMILLFAGLAAIKWAATGNMVSLKLSGAQYAQPNYFIYNNMSGLTYNPTQIADNLTAADFEVPNSTEYNYRYAGGVTNDVNFSYYLLDTIAQYKTTRYSGICVSNQFYNQRTIFQPNRTLGQVGTATVFHNQSGTHALPVSVNAWHTALLRFLMGDPTQTITIRNYPFPETASAQAVSGLSGGIIIGIGFAFIPSSWVSFAVKEREINAKHQQLISGVSTFAYWASTLVWDVVNYLVPLFLGLILIACFGIDSLIGENAGATFLSMLLYGPSIATFTYVFSFLFKSHSTAQNVMIVVYVFTGVLLAMVSFILDAISTTQEVNSHLKFLYRLLPNFCFGECILNLIARQATLGGSIRGIWDMDVVGWPCVYMTLETFFFFGVVLLIEKILATPAIISYFVRGQQVQDAPFQDDEDVSAEKKRLQEDDATNKDVVKVRGLRKEFHFFRRPAKVAVKDMWFGIHEGECFGFLGINGAGKTTTLQMLTGAEYATCGAATLKGFDIMHQQEELRRHMGYCPQFDALIETLTGRETLALYARIKGVPESKVSTYVKAMIQRIGLKDYADRPCGGYSGGNKRKLSVGVALIGNPTVIFLDEPSTGMDPGAKRFMWDLISATNAGRSLILTTHSLEEAEALCHRIGIMVSGRLRCLGSAQHLRHRYGQGYQIELKTHDNKEAISNLRKWMEGTFEGAQLVEIHGDRLKYKIHRTLSLGGVFGEIERNKNVLSIQEYSCAEYSLEQIFIHFAKQQEEEQAHVEGVVGSGN